MLTAVAVLVLVLVYMLGQLCLNRGAVVSGEQFMHEGLSLFFKGFPCQAFQHVCAHGSNILIPSVFVQVAL